MSHRSDSQGPRKRPFIAVLTIAVAATAAGAAAAQQASLSGVITDTTDANLPGVTVTATNRDTGTKAAAITDERGPVPPAAARARHVRGASGAERLPHRGRRTSRTAGRPARIRTADAVHRPSGRGRLRPERSAAGRYDVLASRRQRRSAADGSAAAAGAQLAGAVEVREGHHRQRDHEYAGRRGRSVPAQSRRPADHAEDRGSGFGQPRFSRESIAEFQIVTNLFDITQGRSLGMQVQAISRAGTNTIAGSFYGNFRHDRAERAQSDLEDRPALREPADRRHVGRPDDPRSHALLRVVQRRARTRHEVRRPSRRCRGSASRHRTRTRRRAFSDASTAS